MTLSEETLNAYCDGALDADACAEVEACLKTDAAARELLERLRRANALAMRAFEEPFREPPPQALIDAILKGPGREAASDSTTPLRTRAFRGRRIRDYAVPLAASLALAIGIAAGFLFGSQPGQGPDELALGAVPGGSQLHRLLEDTPSGQILEINGRGGSARRHTVVGTFRDRHARPCREVEVLPPDTDQQPLAAGVACRRAEGGWVVEGAVRLAHVPSASSQQFEPSGVTEKDALEGLLMILGAQAALSSEEEQVLMRQGWK